jgi:hypothetical protein
MMEVHCTLGQLLAVVAACEFDGERGPRILRPMFTVSSPNRRGLESVAEYAKEGKNQAESRAFFCCGQIKPNPQMRAVKYCSVLH